VQGRPFFAFTPPKYVSEEFLEFVRGRLARVSETIKPH